MRSLRVALTIRLLLGGVLLFGAAGIFFQWRLQQALLAEFDSSLTVAAHSLEALVENENGKIRMEGQAQEMPEFGHRGGTAIFLLARADGAEIQRSRSLGDLPLVMPAATSDVPVFSEITLPDGRRMRCVSRKVDVDTEDHAEEAASPVQLLVGRDSRPLESTLREIRNALLATGLITLGALAVLLLWGVRHGLAPLGKLVEEISKIDGHSLSTRLDAGHAPSELLPVVDRLNELLARLERVFEREKRFTADVSHELRTPLAELRALAEVNLLTAPAGAACWGEVQAIALRMESLSVHLLELARAEQPGQIPRRESVNLNSLLARTLERHAEAAAARNLSFTTPTGGTVIRESDPVLMELIVSNLISNVTHHATPGTSARIELEQEQIKVSNTVASLSPAELPHLFDRSWKSDRSRSDARRHGLGLTLAKEAARLLGGSLDLEFDPQTSIITFIHHFGRPGPTD